MSTYRLFFTTTASSVVEVEADDLETAIDLAYDELPNDVCAQCGGWGSDRPGVELAGEWDMDETLHYVDGEVVESPGGGAA